MPKKRMFKTELKQIKVAYDGPAHGYKMMRSPRQTIIVDDSVINPTETMNIA